MATSGFERLVQKRHKLPPGYQHYWNERRQGSSPAKTGPPLPDDSVPRWRSSTPIQQAPYKPGQTARTQRLKRRTRPNPYANPHNPRVD